MRRILYRLSLIATLLPVAAKAQEKQPVSMTARECVEYALRNHASMKNALLDEKTQLAKNKEITGLALPQLSASGGIQYAPLVAAFQVPNFIKGEIIGAVDPKYLNSDYANSGIGTLPLAFQPRWTTNGQLELNQIVYDPSVMVALQARKSLEQLAREQVNLTSQQLQVNVMKAYYNILVAEQTQSFIEQNLKRITELHGQTKAIYESGLAEKIEVDRLTVTMNNIKTQQIRIGQTIDIAYLQLKFQMGMPLAQPIDLADTLTEEKLTTEILSHPLVYENRVEFKLQNIQINLNEYDLKRYKLQGLPSLNLFGNYGYTKYNAEKLLSSGDEWQRSALIGTKLSVPIFQGFQRTERVKQAKYALEKSLNTMDNLKQALDLETANAKSALQANLLALANQRENMELAENVYNIAKIKYQEGVGSSLEVVDAEASLKEAQTNYFNALFDAVDARINLQRALGELRY